MSDGLKIISGIVFLVVLLWLCMWLGEPRQIALQTSPEEAEFGSKLLSTLKGKKIDR